jgi:hypothetical protein
MVLSLKNSKNMRTFPIQWVVPSSENGGNTLRRYET